MYSGAPQAVGQSVVTMTNVADVSQVEGFTDDTRAIADYVSPGLLDRGQQHHGVQSMAPDLGGDVTGPLR